MGFHHIRFPVEISLGARGGPQWATDIVELSSGAEHRNSRWAHSRRHYDAGFGVKSKADLRTILSFFEERRGSFHGFLFKDPIDFSSSENAPTALDQAIGTGDGIKTQFQLKKKYGAAFDPYFREINKPIAGTALIGVAGVALAPSQYGVDEATGIVTLNVAPAAGVLVSAGFEFDVPVRFASDRLDIEITSFNAAIAPTIKLVEVRL
ncbi:phage distal tail protein, Rcc01695 family [Maritalea sp.]|uniref:phage distal tail protein, Rcc01695 family n=1 Tax=Maritalea sp. TaxID=2003361 RepID=UPI003EF8DBA6